MIDRPFHHSLHVREDLCKGCTHCMKRCPTGAIRIAGGKAQIISERCIDCGQCMAVCPNNAMAIEESLFGQLLEYTHRVAVIPAVFFAQFPDIYTVQQICRAFYDCGFTQLYLAETGIDILHLLKATEADQEKPLISNYCPSVQRLIQIRYPLLLDNLSRKRTPAQIVALFARSELEQTYGIEQIGIFYITPCAAKIAQIKTQGSEDNSLFQGVINFDTAYNMIRSLLSKNRKLYALDGDTTFSFPLCTRKAARWCLPKGQCNTVEGRTLAIDEMHNVIEFLELLEQEEDVELDFLELEACAQGCAGGILAVRNRFLASERLRHWSESLPKELPKELEERILKHKQYLLPQLYQEQPKPKTTMKLDEDMAKALHKMEKARQILAVLPRIDCGLCGAPTCKALAEDIAKSKASIRQCVVLKLKDPKELNSLARIWGERPTVANVPKGDQA
ncbi:[Fe-Fe] hydrogenase large subunit C-terminal domain-containing protein [uncultured Sphaerochaeta sp.]|uniref:[Fe-Fe] hydrogenase large subunit C-terminal domain-containing protein n=1 Tax=uncultured Sphaerochaeta sp. TaxID=886478 RepID=UPI002A0A6743|nr:[Fe-Fe] hydrogenase large subunit C-terminal domain-containing protein [uncultured Sphaerochaeta sp.]